MIDSMKPKGTGHERPPTRFSSISEMMRLEGEMVIKKKGENVFEPETKSDVCRIISGTVALTSGENGHIRTAGMVLPGDIIEKTEKYPWIAQAIETTTLHFVEKYRFHNLVYASTSMTRELVDNSNDQLHRSLEFNLLLQIREPLQRVATFILLWLKNHSPKAGLSPDNKQIEFPFTQDDMRGIVALTREHVSLNMNKLRRMGIINYGHANGKIPLEILNIEELRKVAEGINVPSE